MLACLCSCINHWVAFLTVLLLWQKKIKTIIRCLKSFDCLQIDISIPLFLLRLLLHYIIYKKKKIFEDVYYRSVTFNVYRYLKKTKQMKHFFLDTFFGCRFVRRFCLQDAFQSRKKRSLRRTFHGNKDAENKAIA